MSSEQEAVRSLWESRRDRRSVPEGSRDKRGRWEPSAREDAGRHLTGRLRPPTRAWPWSYWRGANARPHCAVLVRRALDGYEVPRDVWLALQKAFRVSTRGEVLAAALAADVLVFERARKARRQELYEALRQRILPLLDLGLAGVSDTLGRLDAAMVRAL